MYINYQTPPPSKFQPGFTKIFESLAKKTPEIIVVARPENRDQAATSEERVNPQRRNRRARQTGLTS